MKYPFTLITHNNSQGIVQKGGQVTKPIMVVIIPCELLCVIKVKGYFINNQLNFLALDDIRAFSR